MELLAKLETGGTGNFPSEMTNIVTRSVEQAPDVKIPY
jgi:hypothetical protein